MVIELNPKEIDLLVTQLEVMIIPELRCEIASGMPKALSDELKREKVALTQILEKLKAAA
jgi:hypothetical protein